MKTLSFYLFVFVLFLSIKIDAQEMNTWRISVGYSNFSKSDDLLIGNHYSNFNNFNFPNTLSIEKRFHNNFSFKFSGTVNEFEKISPIQNLYINQKNDLFLGLDFALKYSLMGEKGKNTWFNPFLTAGIGYSKFDTFGDTKLTAGVGSNFWIKKNFGIQVGSTYNKSVALENSNYLNHFVGFIVLFNRNLKTNIVEKNNTELNKSEEDQKIIVNYDSEIDKKEKKIEQKDQTIINNQIADLKKVEIKDEKIEKPTEEIVHKTNTKVESNLNELKTEKVLDSDGDKVPDEFDKCPTVFGEASNAGCPKKTEVVINNKSNPISTNQNISNSENNTSKVETNLNELKTEKVLDSDGDKVPDEFDKCPTVFGEASNAGCPKKTEVVINNKSNPISTNQNISNSENNTSKVKSNLNELKTEKVLDSDGDKVPDEFDKCPTVFGEASHAGCPKKTEVVINNKSNPISTNQNISNSENNTSKVKSNLNELKTEKVLDSDGDKVPDEFDKCPTVFGEASNAGCPKKTEVVINNKSNPISTNQNISNSENNTSKVKSNLNELKTEKVLDSDGDKVPDEFDKCPTVFGEASNAGCPKKTEVVINNKSNPISTNQNISNSENNTSKVETNESILKVTNVYFDTDEANVLDDEKSKIHMIIYIMEKNPNSKIIIEGHTAKDGDRDYNKKLSENRAKAVKQYLINKGVNAEKIEIKSLGSSQPTTTENTEKAKALNRRARIVLTK